MKRKARAEGLVEGLAEGRAEGIAKGRIEGEQNKTLEIAHKMKSRGYQLEEIIENTGLSMEIVKNL
jgi:predicted transposase/invertase (TIGR01784 family)